MDLCGFLVANGASVEFFDNSGDSPFDIAVQNMDQNLINLFDELKI